MATPYSPINSGYTQSIRQNLIGQGVKDSDIGMNKATGYVTVGGKDAIKAPKTYNGTSYTTKQGFTDDWNNYNKSLQQPAGGQVNAGAAASATGQSTTNAYDPYKTNNPYDSQYNDLLKTLMDQAKNPTPVDANAIYNSPQWAAYQAQVQKGAQQGVRASQESLGGAGFGRSTTLGERAQGIQNDANEYLNTQVLPQLMAQESASRQQQFQNQFSTLDALMGQQNVYDNRFNNANQYALNKGELTGNFRDPQADQLINKILQDKQDYAAASTPEQRAAETQSATNARNQLAAMGIDPDQYGANKTLEQAQSGFSKAGVKTIGGQNLEMQKIQQEWENNFNQAQFDESKAATLWERAFKEKSFAQDMKEAAASRGLQWASLGQRDKEFIADQAFREKEFKYRQEQDLIEQRENPATDIDSKASTDTFNILLDDINNADSPASKEEARNLLSQNSSFLSDSDYKKLNDYINENL
jgi:hypothetical protein